MHKLHAILKKAGISLLTAFTVFTNTNMGTLVALAAEPHLDEGEELYQITDDENTYTVREYTTDNSEVLFALRPETTYSADDQYEAYADDGVDTYLNDNDLSEEQQTAIRKIISIGYGSEPSVGNYIASQVLIWQVTADKTYEVDENVAANMEALQARIEAYDMDPGFAGQEVTLEGYGEDHAVTLEDGSFTGYAEKEIPAGYHVEINDGSLKLWVDEGTEAGTLSFEKKSLEMKSILYKGTNGEFLSLGMEPKEISVNAKIEVPETAEEPKEEKVEEKAEESQEAKTDAKLEKGLKAAKAPVNNESVVAESVGDVRLIDISDVHVAYLKEKRTNGTLKEGEKYQLYDDHPTFVGRLEWSIPNHIDLTNVEAITYQMPKNLNFDALSGSVMFQGTEVGTFSIDENTNLLTINYNDDFKAESNRTGWLEFEADGSKLKFKNFETSLKFESGEEYPVQHPQYPRVGIEKIQHKVSDMNTGPYSSHYDSSAPNNRRTNYDFHFTVNAYSNGENNNVVIDDTYEFTDYGSFQAGSGFYIIRILNSAGQIVFTQEISEWNSVPIGFSVPLNSNGYSGEFYLDFQKSNTSYPNGTNYQQHNGILPSLRLDHLNDGDMVTIDYYLNPNNPEPSYTYRSTFANTATVISDENPEVLTNDSGVPITSDKAFYNPITKQIKFLSQQDTVSTDYNPDTFVKKTATVSGDTVHFDIVWNENQDMIRTSWYKIFPLTSDIMSNISVTDSDGNHYEGLNDDADYLLDMNSFKIEISSLVHGQREVRKVIDWKDFPKDQSHAFMVYQIFTNNSSYGGLMNFIGGSSKTTILDNLPWIDYYFPIITFSYDLKLNPEKIHFDSCSDLKIEGSNTVKLSGENVSFFRSPENKSYEVEKTVEYSNTFSSPVVQKAPWKEETGKSTDGMDPNKEYIYWKISVTVPKTGLTNLIIKDLPADSLVIDPSYNNGKGFIVSQDVTNHENPIVFDATTGTFSIDGRIENNNESMPLILYIRTIKEDPSSDPNFTILEDGTIEEHYTNRATISADEIVNSGSNACAETEQDYTSKQYQLINKTAESDQNKVHMTVSVNEKGDIKKISSPDEVLNHLYDKMTNFAAEPAEDKDYYMDMGTLKMKVASLVDGEPQTVITKNFSNISPATIDNVFTGNVPLMTLLTESDPDGVDALMDQISDIEYPVITFSYDLLVNQKKFVTCDQIEYTGTNTVIFEGSSLFASEDTEYRFEKTVNYKNYITPPSVTKKYVEEKVNIAPNYIDDSQNTEELARDTEYIYWDLDVYIPVVGLTNLKVTDLPAASLQIDGLYNGGTGFKVIEDETEHENPIVFNASTGEFTVAGRIENPNEGKLTIRLRTIKGDPTLDPNYKVLEDGTVEEHYTNKAEIHADEIINPCAKCPGCDEGHCSKTKRPAAIVNKEAVGEPDDSSGYGVYFTWHVQAELSSIEDISVDENNKFSVYLEDTLPEGMLFNGMTAWTIRNGENILAQYPGNNSQLNIGSPVVDGSYSKERGQIVQFAIWGNPAMASQLKGATIDITYRSYLNPTRNSTGYEYIKTGNPGDPYTYTNKVELYVNEDKKSEAEAVAKYSIPASYDIRKKALTYQEFVNRGYSRDVLSTGGLQHNTGNVRNSKDERFIIAPYEENFVAWEIETDLSTISDDTHHITISDVLPDSQKYDTSIDFISINFRSNVNNSSPQNQFYIYDGQGYEWHSADPRLKIERYTAGRYPGIVLSLSDYCKTNYPDLTLKDVLLSIAGGNITSSAVMDVVLGCQYTPKSTDSNASLKETLTNKVDLLINGVTVDFATAQHELDLKPVEKTVKYDESTAPYAEYTVTLHPYIPYNNTNYPMIFEDTPGPFLEILEDSVELSLVTAFYNGSNPGLTTWGPLNLSTMTGQNVNGLPSYYRPKMTIDSNGKLRIELNHYYDQPWGVNNSTTFIIKYKARILKDEGATLGESNAVTWTPDSSHSFYQSNILSGTTLGNSFSKSQYVMTNIFKKDAKSNAALEGAEFRIDKLTLNEEHTTVVKTETYGTPYATGSDGHTDTVKLNYDTVYRIVETEVPEGYLDSNKVTRYVVFPGHDNIDWSKVSVDGIDYIEVIEPHMIDKSNKVSEATVTITNVKESSKKIVLTKTDEKGRILPNATFSLSGSDGSYTEYKTKSDGTLEINNLVRGVTYTLAEKEAPQFYDKNENVIIFTVSDKGEITSPTIQKYNVEYDGGKGTVTDGETTSDSINKEVDSGGNISLPEANAPEGYHFVHWTDENGNIVDNNTVVNQNMHVTAKYEHDTHTVTFKVEDGVMSYREHLNVTEFDRIVPHGSALQTMPSVKPAGEYQVLTGWFDEDGNEVTKDTVVDKDMVITAKVENYMLESGPTFASELSSGVKHVVFGNTADYESVVSEAEGVNVDIDDAGTIKAYTIDDTMYVLSDHTIFFNPDSSQMFMNSNCSLESITFENIDTSLMTNMNSMFEGQSALTALDLSGFTTNNVTSMSSLFKNCEVLADVNLSSLNTSSVTAMDEMFLNNKKLTSLDLRHFDTSDVTTMSQMFKGCTKLTDLDVSSFNTSNVVDMESMFAGLKAMTTLDVSNFDTSNVTNMQSMFNGNEKLTQLNLSNFNTSNVVNMKNMFEECSTLKSLDLSNFNTANVTAMDSMFNNCSALETLDISGMDTTGNPNRTNMFTGTTALSTIYLGDSWTAVSDSGFSAETWSSVSNDTTSTKNGADLMSDYTTSDAGEWFKGTINVLYDGPTLNAIFKKNIKYYIIFGKTNKISEEQKTSATEVTVSDSSKIKGYLIGSSLYILSDDPIFLNSNCSKMFSDCIYLTEVEFGNVRGDFVTTMERMFTGCSNLSDILYFGNMNLPKLTNTSYMFYNTPDNGANRFRINISNIDVNKLVNYTKMFTYATGDVYVKGLDILFYQRKTGANTRSVSFSPAA